MEKSHFGHSDLRRKCLKSGLGDRCPWEALEVQLETAGSSCLLWVCSAWGTAGCAGAAEGAPAALVSHKKANWKLQIAERGHQGSEDAER